MKKNFKRDPYFIDIEKNLSEKFGSKVFIKTGKIKSKIEIEYYSDKDLEKIINILSK